MSDKKTIAIDEFVSYTPAPDGQSFAVTVKQDGAETDLVVPSSQAPSLFILALHALPQPSVRNDQLSVASSFETSGLAAGRDPQGRLGLTLVVQNRAVSFVIPPDQEANLRATLASFEPSIPTGPAN